MSGRNSKLIRRQAKRIHPQGATEAQIQALKDEWNRTPRKKRAGLAARWGRARKRPEKKRRQA